MPVDTYDAVIAGGGLSGLSLVAHMAGGGWQGRNVLLVNDPATTAVSAWAYWSTGAGLLDPAASRQFRRLAVHSAGLSRVLPLAGDLRYQVVRRDDLRRMVEDLVRACPGFRLRDGHVDAIRQRPDGAEVVVDGRTVRAAWAFDATGLAAPGAAGGVPPAARIAFAGWRVACERAVFVPDTATLFDFRLAATGRARFAYLIPDTPRRGLVEFVEFVPPGGAVPDTGSAWRALQGYLGGVLHAGAVRPVPVEAAAVPLVPSVPPRRGRVLPIGARAGLIKASTGYGYRRIQLDSAAIVASLVRHGHPLAGYRPRQRYRLLDALLLDAIAADPAQLEVAFARLFSANPPERVLRFLDERAGPYTLARLVASLPPGPYLRAAARAVTRTSRRP